MQALSLFDTRDRHSSAENTELLLLLVLLCACVVYVYASESFLFKLLLYLPIPSVNKVGGAVMDSVRVGMELARERSLISVTVGRLINMTQSFAALLRSNPIVSGH